MSAAMETNKTTITAGAPPEKSALKGKRKTGLKGALLGAVCLSAATAFGQSYSISPPDMAGDSYITGPRGDLLGTIEGTDMTGTRYFHYNNGFNGYVTPPDMSGTRHIQVMPRSPYFGGSLVPSY
jgi:hypothetical protein